MMIESCGRSGMDTIQRVAVVPELQIQLVRGEAVPHRRFGGAEVIPEEIHQELVVHHQVRDVLCSELSLDLERIRSRSNRAQKKSRQLAAVVKIISFTIIRPSP